MKAIIERKYGDTQTLGTLTFYDDHGFSFLELKTLELPWRENKNGVSCIPEGEYFLRKRKAHESGKFDHDHLILSDRVGGVTLADTRSYILIHRGNFYTDIKGCILTGFDLKDINGDGLMDVTNSTGALESIFYHCDEYLEEDQKIIIRSEQNV
jgi:hypothetical protein